MKINSLKTKVIFLFLMTALFFFSFTTTNAAQVYDDFSNIAGWERQGVVLNFGASYEDTLLQDPTVLYNTGGGALFKMWYSSAGQISYAESSDGRTWTKYSGNPVVRKGSSGASDSTYAGVPSVEYYNGAYYMMYCGMNGSVAKVHMATATNPQGPWTKIGAVISPTLSWEDNYIYNCELKYDGGWKAWYTAGRIASAGGEPEFICYATATNPTGPWTKYSGNPIVSPMNDGGWASLGIGGPAIIKKNGAYYMEVVGWQADYPSRQGQLTSSDGIHWTLSRSNLIFDLGRAGNFDDHMVYRGRIVNVNGTDYVYYNGKDTKSGWNERIGLAIWKSNLAIVNPAKWTTSYGPNIAGGGTFGIESGKLKTLGIAPSGAQQVLQGNVKINAANYSVSADVTPLSTTDAGKDNVLRIRDTALNTYYYGGIGSWGAQYAIGKMVGGVNTKLASTGAVSAITTNMTYNLKLSVNGSTIQLYANGTLVLSATDSSLNPSSSYIGLETANAAGQAYFDNVVVDTGTSQYDPDTNYKIVNKKSDRALSCMSGGTANNTNLIIYDYVSATDQMWKIQEIGGGYYKLKNNRSGRLASCLSGGASNGTYCIIYDDVNATDQFWSIQTGSAGYLKIINQRSGRALSCKDGGTSNNTQIHLWDYLGGYDDQDWTIVPAN